MLKKILSLSIVGMLVLSGCTSNKDTLKDHLDITKLNGHTYVLHNRNTYYDEKTKHEMGQSIDVYINNKLVVKEMYNQDYAVVSSIDQLTVKKSKKQERYKTRFNRDVSIDLSAEIPTATYTITKLSNKPITGHIYSIGFNKNKIIEAHDISINDEKVFKKSVQYSTRVTDVKDTLMIYNN